LKIDGWKVTGSIQIKAANSLLSITHSLKLMHLLSDESQVVKQKDADLRAAQADINEYKIKVAGLLNELLQTEG
jgi:mediator of RNA polymerase II transcription subunit 22